MGVVHYLAMSRDWDDLRYFLALARTGSVRQAATALRVTHSTVSRRVAALEDRMGARLFEKLPSGYVTTVAGERMIAYAEQVEESFAEMDLTVQGMDQTPSGVVRVATVDVLMLGLSKHFAAFRRAHPTIRLEVLTGPRSVNLAHREADAAIRLTNNPDENLVGRRIAPMTIAPYASRDYLDSLPPGTPIEAMQWIAWPSAGTHPIARWMQANVPEENVGLRVNTSTSHYIAVTNHLGVSFINCFVCDQDPRLRRVLEPDPAMSLDVWVVTHEDLRATARVRVFLDFMYECLGQDAELIAGKRPKYATWSTSAP